MAFPRKDQAVNDLIAEFDVNKHAPRLDWIRPILDATNPDLTAFRDRKGKLLMYFGWADQSLNAQMGVNYYESAVKKMGPATAGFFRLFMQPGVFHCGGGGLIRTASHPGRLGREREDPGIDPRGTDPRWQDAADQTALSLSPGGPLSRLGQCGRCR
jgi:hypothetical protein